MKVKDTVMTPEEIKQGCSAYIDHGGGIGFPCRFKPTLRYNGKLYCTLHNPIRLKAISDKRSAEFIEGMNRAEQSRKDSDDRLREEGRQAGRKEVVEFLESLSFIECDYGEISESKLWLEDELLDLDAAETVTYIIKKLKGEVNEDG